MPNAKFCNLQMINQIFTEFRVKIKLQAWLIDENGYVTVPNSVSRSFGYCDQLLLRSENSSHWTGIIEHAFTGIKYINEEPLLNGCTHGTEIFNALKDYELTKV